MTIAFLDVDYRADGARAACLLAASWSAATASSVHAQDIASVEPYEPGAFYRRELPCLLSVLALLAESPTVLVVDGYVWLSSKERKGLGAHLFDALGARLPVVGIAKTAFAGVDDSPVVASVFRGGSKNPLYVSAVGMALDVAASHVQGMAGAHRIPDLVRAVDHAARGWN